MEVDILNLACGPFEPSLKLFGYIIQIPVTTGQNLELNQDRNTFNNLLPI